MKAASGPNSLSCCAVAIPARFRSCSQAGPKFFISLMRRSSLGALGIYVTLSKGRLIDYAASGAEELADFELSQNEKKNTTATTAAKIAGINQKL